MSMIRLEGLEQALSKLDAQQTEVDKERRRFIADGVETIARDVKRSIASHQSKGRVYHKVDPKRTHVASAPFNPPNQDTGELGRGLLTSSYDNYETAQVGWPDGELGDRAKRLEFGEHNMLPRPSLFPAAERYKATLVDRFEKLVERINKVKI